MRICTAFPSSPYTSIMYKNNDARVAPHFSGEPAWMETVKSNDPVALQKALDNGLSLKENYEEPLFLRTKTNAMNPLHVLFDSVSTPDSKVVQILLDKGVGINSREGDTGWTALHRLMYRLYPSAEAAKELLSRGIDVNARGSDGQTAMHVLVDRCWTQPKLGLVRLLHEHGAKMNIRDDSGCLPVNILVQRQDPNIEVADYMVNTADTKAEKLAIKQELIKSYKQNNLNKAANLDRKMDYEEALKKLESIPVQSKTSAKPIQSGELVPHIGNDKANKKEDDSLKSEKTSKSSASLWTKMIGSVKGFFDALLRWFRLK